MVDQPLRFPVESRVDQAQSVRLSLLNRSVCIEIGPIVLDTWVPLQINAQDEAAGAAFIEHVARWLGRSVGKPNPSPPTPTPPGLRGTYLVGSAAMQRGKLSGKASFDSPQAEVYINLDGDVLLFGEKDEGYARPLMEALARGLRDGEGYETPFPEKRWPPVEPMVKRGPAEDMDPRVAVDSALHVAGLGASTGIERLIANGQEQLANLLEDPRTARESLLIVHARFVTGTLERESHELGRQAIDRARLLRALSTAEAHLRPGDHSEYRECVRDLRLLWDLT